MIDLTEIHTSDIASASHYCPNKVGLKLMGHEVKTLTSALWIGCVTHGAIEICYRRSLWDEVAVDDAIKLACKQYLDECADDGITIPESFDPHSIKDRHRISDMVHGYAKRLKPDPDDEILGVEVPIRYTLEHPSLDKPQEFASHLDLLIRKAGQLVVWDWKTGLKQIGLTRAGEPITPWPSKEYLARDLQMAFYFLAVAEGSVRLGGDGFEWWENLGEFPQVSWIHMSDLISYKRKTTGTDENGEPVEYAKGDEKPLKNIIRWCDFMPDLVDEIKNELASRVLMMRAGFWPKIPHPIGCSWCDVASACQGYDRRVRDV